MARVPPSTCAISHAWRTWPRISDLADHRRVEPGRDLEQVPDRGVVVMRVEVRVQLVGGDVADLAQEVADVGVGAVEALGDGVDLGAVARADQDDLAHVVAIGETTDGLGDLVRREGNALEHADRAAAMVDSDDQDRHGQASLRAHTTPPMAGHGV